MLGMITTHIYTTVAPSRSSDLSMWPTTIVFNVTWILRTTQLGLCPHNTHLTSHPHWQAMAQIAKTQGLMSIRYRSNTKVLDRYLIDVNLSLCYLGDVCFEKINCIIRNLYKNTINQKAIEYWTNRAIESSSNKIQSFTIYMDIDILHARYFV